KAEKPLVETQGGLEMRVTNVLGAVICGFLISACGGESNEVKPAVAPTPPPAESAPAPIASAPAEAPVAPPAEPKKTAAELQVAAVKSVMDGWNSGDAKKVAGTYADNATFTMAGMPDVHGRDGVQAYAQKMLDAFPKMK